VSSGPASIEARLQWLEAYVKESDKAHDVLTKRVNELEAKVTELQDIVDDFIVSEADEPDPDLLPARMN
jgi:tetrahydromethanopterin S-methyltransferase subunit B